MYKIFFHLYIIQTCICISNIWSFSCKSRIICRRVKIPQKYQAIAVTCTCTRLNFVSFSPCFDDRHGVVETLSKFLTHPGIYDWIDGTITVRDEQGRILKIFEEIGNLQSQTDSSILCYSFTHTKSYPLKESSKFDTDDVWITFSAFASPTRTSIIIFLYDTRSKMFKKNWWSYMKLRWLSIPYIYSNEHFFLSPMLTGFTFYI